MARSGELEFKMAEEAQSLGKGRAMRLRWNEVEGHWNRGTEARAVGWLTRLRNGVDKDDGEIRRR